MLYKTEIKVNIKAEIHFYQNKKPNNIAILLENNSDEKDKKFGEILLFLLYTIRTGVNLYRNCEVLGRDLIRFVQAELAELPPNFPRASKFDNKRIEGEKIFRIPLVFNTVTGEFNFTIKSKGFGFLNLGGDIIMYAPISVLALFDYLYLERKNDQDYIEKLAKAALLCGRTLKDKGVNVKNQHETALSIAFVTFKEETNHIK